MTVRSLTDKVLEPPTFSAESLAKLEANLATAQANFSAEPNLENTVWLGRRLAYLFRYDEAIAVYSEGIDRFPNAYQLYRHRGHRYISTRQFDAAIADFERAAELAADQPIEVEPDGTPNRLNKPTSTGHFNIWYHLALSYYLTGQFERAAEAWRVNLDRYCDNDDSLVATVDWLFMTYRRLGDVGSAEKLLDLIEAEMSVIESDSYHRRLLMYKGLRSPESLLVVDEENSAYDYAITLATQGYGVGNWYFYNGDKAAAKAIFEQVVSTSNWSAFGFIAAEVDLLTL